MNEGKSNRPRSIQIADPASLFVNWKYRIDKHHYESLGLTYRQFIKNKKPYYAWVQMSPIEYVFKRGYIFYQDGDSSIFLQVAADWDAFRIEVHSGTVKNQKIRHAYAVAINDFADWLKTGIVPADAKLLNTALSKAGFLAWEITSSYSCNSPSSGCA